MAGYDDAAPGKVKRCQMKRARSGDLVLGLVDPLQGTALMGANRRKRHDVAGRADTVGRGSSHEPHSLESPGETVPAALQRHWCTRESSDG